MMDLLFPRFSSEKLPIWFAQVESVFTLNGILSDSDKYNYTVAHIPLEHISMVEDIILNPPSESKYDHIKYEFIKRMSIQRLNKEEIGTEKPSLYLQRLRKMADQRVPMEAVLNTWLQHLPTAVRDVVSLESSGRVEVIGPMADKIMALLPSTSPQHTILMPCDQFEVILQRIDKLSKQVQAVHEMLDSDGFSEQSVVLPCNL